MILFWPFWLFLRFRLAPFTSSPTPSFPSAACAATTAGTGQGGTQSVSFLKYPWSQLHSQALKMRSYPLLLHKFWIRCFSDHPLARPWFLMWTKTVSSKVVKQAKCMKGEIGHRSPVEQATFTASPLNTSSRRISFKSALSPKTHSCPLATPHGHGPFTGSKSPWFWSVAFSPPPSPPPPFSLLLS